MSARHFRFGWRALAADPWHAVVALGGLALACAAFILLTGFVRHAWNVNAGIPGADDIHILKQRDNTAAQDPWYDQAPMALAPVAAALPGVTAATAFVPLRPEAKKLLVRANGRLAELPGLTVLPGFAAMLGLRAQHGDLRAALESPDGIVLTAVAARRLFGTADAVGRTLRAEGQLLRVAAVLAPQAGRTTITFDALTGVRSAIVEPAIREELLTARQGWPGKVLVRLAPGTSVAAVRAALQQATDRMPALQRHAPDVLARLAGRKPLEIDIVPLRHAYFDDTIGGNFVFGAGERSNPVLVAGLAAAAVAILALAAFNYVNLAAVRVLRRQREIALRKVLGASARGIVLQCVAEALLVVLPAMALGLLIAWLALPAFAALMGRDLAGMLTPAHVLTVLATGCALALVTAAWPAWLALRVHPEQALGGRPETESRGAARTRRVLTALQMAGAMAFAGVALAIAWQAHYAAGAAPGFDPAPLTIVDLPEQVRHSAAARGYAAALAAQPGIDGVAVSLDAVGRRDDTWFRELQRPGTAPVSMEMKSVGANFFEVYGLRAEAGRLFAARTDRDDDPVPLVLNAAAARALGFATPAAALGQTVLFREYDGKVQAKQVVGIAPDVRFQSLREAPAAIAYELHTLGSTLTVRSRLPAARVEALARQLFPRYFPEALPKVHRAGAVLAQNYADDTRLARLLLIATGVALAIAACGSYVLSAHVVQRRAREIVLRKLHGARGAAIGGLVLREIGTLALAAAAVGLPVAALVSERYLAAYVERAPAGGWALACALAATVLVALGAAGRHAWMAMRVLPARALRM